MILKQNIIASMSIMFNKLNTSYIYFTHAGFYEQYLKVRNIILENKYHCNIFLSKTDINEKYERKYSNDDIEANMNEVVNILNMKKIENNEEGFEIIENFDECEDHDFQYV
jgi:hypothetical protein